MRFSHINPNRLSSKELRRLLQGQKVRSRYFGTIKLTGEKELKENPPPELPEENKNFLPIVWI